MLAELCHELNNYFLREKHFGVYTIASGGIDLPFIQEGQYFRIVGSVFNDGVYKYPVSNLTDESFDGAIWAMAVPPSVIALASEIEAWISNNAEVLEGPYQSESFGGYSYSKETGADGMLTWQGHFASRLNAWRKARVNR